MKNLLDQIVDQEVKNEIEARIELFLQVIGEKADIDINCFVNIENIEESDVFENIYQAIENNSGFNVEIIYYSNAIEFLQEHDNSLRDSLALASEYGYSIGSLSSEILASLLASDLARSNFNDCKDEIEDFFSSLVEEVEGLIEDQND